VTITTTGIASLAVATHDTRGRWLAALLVVVVVLGGPARAVADDPQPHTPAPSPSGGWTLDASNWRRAEQLLPAAVLRRVQSGDYWYRVEPVDSEAFKAYLPAFFWEQSRSNEGRYAVDAKTCGLVDVETGVVAKHLDGLPFPTIADDDPRAGYRIAWNMRAVDMVGRGGETRFTINGIDERGEYKRIKLTESHTSFMGKASVPSQGEEEHLRSASLLTLLEPTDLNEVGGLTKRVNDWTTSDKMWFFVPATRRVRRVGSSWRSKRIAELEIFHDDLGGFASKIEYFEWRLIGQADVLAPIVNGGPLAMMRVSETRHEMKPPYISAAYETPGSRGVPWLLVDGMTMAPRPVWIVEGRSPDPDHQFFRVLFYIDRDMYRIYWKLVDDLQGRYFYNAMFGCHWSRTEDGSTAAVSPAFVVGVNDTTNRAAIAGRPTASFAVSNFPRGNFILHTLSSPSD
jgi:hypothetical protein